MIEKRSKIDLADILAIDRMEDISKMMHNKRMSPEAEWLSFQKIKPPLKWAGGKRWLVPYLQPIWEPHKKRRLVEPFCGGLATTLWADAAEGSIK